MGSIESRPYGVLPDGRPVTAWMLTGSAGLTLEVLSLGCIVSRIVAPDRDGRMGDVSLGFESLEGYVADRMYIGAVVGRVAGRIANAAVSIAGREYPLPANEGRNHIHGGIEGFNRKLWTGEATTTSCGEPSVRLTYRSADGEEGYPGNVDITVTYTVTDGNALLFESTAVADAATVLAMTHHAYFNLGGPANSDARSHRVQVFADTYLPVNEDLTISGRVEPLHAGNDLRAMRELNEGFDLYIVGGKTTTAAPATMVRAARVEHEPSGRTIEVTTNERHLQLYSGFALDGRGIGRGGLRYAPFAGMCLECQTCLFEPGDALAYGSILEPGVPQYRATAYTFGTMEKTP